MISYPLSPKVVQKEKDQAVFQIEGLYPGYGVTIANALRRVLLSSLPGVAVTEVKIKGVQHEFSTIPGALEDVIMIVQNLKNLRFKIFEGESHKIELKVKGERKIKGSDFKIPSQVKLANPDCHIATLTNAKAEIEMEILIERGLGYEPKDRRKKKKSEIGVIALDAIYTPIKTVSFQIENMRVGDRTDYDRLNLRIETDGTITPEEAFADSCQILIKHFNIFVEPHTMDAEKVLRKEDGEDTAKPQKAKKEVKVKKVKKAKK
ncbi:MAG: DNA-directed RNA polymerase subunit alpha [Candidatus Staskawiczbacteria bacterium]|jgi:DNA-directed RNA polymerase subunit alpha